MQKTKELINKIDWLEELYNGVCNYEIDPNEYEEEYDEFLNEVHEEVKIGCCTFDPARVLKELDPIAYNEGLKDYVNNISIEDEELYQEKVKDLQEQIDLIEELIEEIDIPEHLQEYVKFFEKVKSEFQYV